MGEWFQIDFGVHTAFCELVLDSQGSPFDGPGAAEVRISDDNITWSVPLAHVTGMSITTMTFETVEAHYVRVTLTGASTDLRMPWWTIHELSVLR